jgi:hypothetical protein
MTPTCDHCGCHPLVTFGLSPALCGSCWVAFNRKRRKTRRPSA